MTNVMTNNATVPFARRLAEVGDGARAVIGGKAAGLARMLAAGIPVPRGYVVTTDAYIDFVEANELEPIMDAIVRDVDFDSPDSVEAASKAARAAILGAAVPASVREAVVAFYEEVGGDTFVAVRSSGIAEDMGDASFAGLYDSFLDVRGDANVVEAVQKCWASLWTARCLSYRHRLGIGHREALVAVVVQEMVDADTAGVLFTANPLNARTDEVVVNATWGLGEAIASGVVTPDEYVLDQETLAVKRKVLGSKTLKITRSDTGQGTQELENSASERNAFSLSDGEVGALATVGRLAVELAGGIPQDLEWARNDGQFYILQSRDITGAEFMWEEELELGATRGDDDETTWSNIWAQEFWTGAVSPLFYSIRGEELSNSDRELFALWGFGELVEVRRFKYHRATVYFSSDADRQYYQNVLPSRLRKGKLANLPPEWRVSAADADFSAAKLLRMFARMQALTTDQGPFRQVKSIYKLMKERRVSEPWPTSEELRGYTDRAVLRELKSKMKLFEDHLTTLRPAFHVYSPWAFALLQEILDHWYEGDNDGAFADLVTGLPRRTDMLQEQVDLWELAEQIRTSPALVQALESHEGADFFAHLNTFQEGVDFLDTYCDFLEVHGHRGHQDRDLWYKRRSEDPMIDYRSFVNLVRAAAPSPADMEYKLAKHRADATAEVLADIRQRPFGAIRVEILKLLLSYILEFLVARDDERPFSDLITMAKKRAAMEMGRRLFERGIVENEDDYFFLGYTEIAEALEERAPARLIRAKIANRRKVFLSFLAREEVPADYLRAGVPLEIEDSSATGIAGTFQGTGTSRGTITGTARVVPSLDLIGKLEKGDILVCNSTDPGWASAFGLIGGLVLETGGMLSHGACLSREYGLPAVTLSGAMGKIKDGDLITVDGDRGRVTIDE